jgi:hypothetical protein
MYFIEKNQFNQVHHTLCRLNVVLKYNKLATFIYFFLSSLSFCLLFLLYFKHLGFVGRFLMKKVVCAREISQNDIVTVQHGALNIYKIAVGV